MIQKLIILGFLKKNPVSGYDISKFINQELGVFSQLNTHSIYYPLKKMEQAGLIEKEELPRKSHIKKYIYHITPRGSKAFLELCKDAFISRGRPFMELDIALYFLPFLNIREIVPLLRLRLRFLSKVKQWLQVKESGLKESPHNLSLLIKHHLKLAAAEIEFIHDIIKSLKNSKASDYNQR